MEREEQQEEEEDTLTGCVRYGTRTETPSISKEKNEVIKSTSTSEKNTTIKPKPMENPDDNMSSTGFEPLFIKEEDGGPDRVLGEQRESNTSQPGVTLLNPSALMKPYLKEMDDLLKSCEELTGLPFGSHFSESFAETSMSETTHLQGTGEVTMESYRGMSASPHSYLSTSYIDTHMDVAATEDQPAHGQFQSVGTIVNKFGVTTEGSRQTEMPLTSAGNKLSETMVEYEGQLLGMLAMLESCMEDTEMDLQSKDWAVSGSQEYVHIRNNPTLYKGTTFVPIEQQTLVKLETQPMQLDSWADKHADGDNVSKDNRNGVAVGSATEGSQQNPLLGCDNTGSFLVERLERALGSQMEKCIEEVQQLQKKRRELLAEVLNLRGNKGRDKAEGSNKIEEETEEQMDNKTAELMNILKKEEEARREERKREIDNLKGERAEEERRLWKVNLERQGLQDELRKLKRRLFAVVRDCAQNNAALNSHNHAVELLKREEEKLQSLVLQLTEEACQLRSAQQQQLSELQAELQAQSSSQTSNTQEELTECRRHSCGDIEQYVQGGLRALEERYEPILLALLKRREATAGALGKAKDQAQELKAQLRPLKEEIQKLKLQRACLEEKLNLIHIHWREDVVRYKETVYCLEENSSGLKTELKIQKKKIKELEELRDSLAKQLLLYSAAIEDHNMCGHGEKT
ncbi:hypothetical protein Q5P01_018084 [Channa striata]|uniref:Syncoilin n=1 Tax=Channa striata TaxID=64152 RepID=A0AA88SDP8_CHASR|nr:hypothetical protein Q5P01_018084 [Channa striata]